MPYLQRYPSGSYHIGFRFGGRLFKRSLRTKSDREATARRERLRSYGFEDIPGVNVAYLSRIEYSGDAKIRLALCIESTQSSTQLAPAVATLCHSVCDMDIMFENDAPQSQWANLRAVTPPFFVR